jgi:hypothetical protein
MWAQDYIEAMESILEPEEAMIEQKWDQLRAELAGLNKARKRGRPRKPSASLDRSTRVVA